MLETAFYASIAVLAANMLVGIYSGKSKRLSQASTLASLAIVLSLSILSLLTPMALRVSGEITSDPFSQALTVVILLDVLIAIYGSLEPAMEYRYPQGVDVLTSAALLGLIGIAWSNSLLMFFSSWILFSASSYALIAIPRDKYSASGASKYALMSLAASNLLLLALGLLVINTRSMLITPTAAFPHVTAVAILALLLASLGFKVGVFPFHAWLPDTYGYSDPLPVSIVAPLSKTATILALYKLSVIIAKGAGGFWLSLVGIMSVFTMTYGNITALLQQELQALLAYSSIAQAGYLLVGVASLALAGSSYEYALYGLALQLLAYSLAKTGLFLLARAIRKNGEKPPALTALRGLGRLNPSLAASTAVLTLSLMGMPPLAGFWGKLFLFIAPVTQAPWLTGIALINTGIAAAYYARLIKAIYFEEGEVKVLYATTSNAVKVLAVLTVLAGLIPFFLHP
ncbi:MAG: proton-conducting transporter membrane subunit [Infirmifilum sp.]